MCEVRDPLSAAAGFDPLSLPEVPPHVAGLSGDKH